MAKKKGGGSNNNNNNGGGGSANKEDGGGKKEVGMNVVVLKIDLHCEGCAAKVLKTVRSFDGVESAKVGDGDLTKLTVVGKLDPTKLREKVEQKTKKKAQLISPAAKKDNNGNETKEINCEEKKKPQPQQQQQQKSDEKMKSTNQNDEKKKSTNQKDAKKKSANQKDEKPKELPVTTAVMKVQWHCQGCAQKIHKIVSKSKGFMEMSIDKQKDLLTVKGAIDSKALAEKLKEKLKRPVEIVQPKKEGGGGDKAKAKNGGGDGGGCEKEKGKKGGEEKSGKGNGGGDGGGCEKEKGKKCGEEKSGKGNGGGGGSKVVEGHHKMEYGGGGQVGQMEYPYEYDYGYGSGYTINQVHAPQLFSDENPNACVVM